MALEFIGTEDTALASAEIAFMLADIDVSEDAGSDWVIDGAFDTIMMDPDLDGDFNESAAWITLA